jgi:tRNA 2-thiouridine synthesizing protein C
MRQRDPGISTEIPDAGSMKGNIFFTTDKLTPERLSWLAELLKFYCARLHPESLQHHPLTPTPPFSFFISGDAAYSIVDRQCAQFWEILFRLPPLRCVFDMTALRLRGISAEPVRMKNPDQVLTRESVTDGQPGAFWYSVLEGLCQDTPDSIGVLAHASPYTHRSSGILPRLLFAAVEKNISPEFYGYLDGVHCAHRDQRTTEEEPVGEVLNEIYSAAARKGLAPQFLACDRSATQRGYSTFSNGKGRIISSCTIPPFKIRPLDEIAARFRKKNQIISCSSFSIQVPHAARIPHVDIQRQNHSPPLVVLASCSPYGTEVTPGAIALALSCAHQGIFTRVVFIEDGVYTVTGRHGTIEGGPLLNLQETIEMTSDAGVVEYYALIPSMKLRGGVAGSTTNGVFPINAAELARLLLSPPPDSDSDMQRVFLF